MPPAFRLLITTTIIETSAIASHDHLVRLTRLSVAALPLQQDAIMNCCRVRQLFDLRKRDYTIGCCIVLAIPMRRTHTNTVYRFSVRISLEAVE